MKRLKTTLVLLVLIPAFCSAQKKLIWDFNGKNKPSKNLTFNSKEKIIIQVKNINTFLYKVDITVSGKSFFQTNGFSFVNDLLSQLNVGNIALKGQGESNPIAETDSTEIVSRNELKDLSIRFRGAVADLDETIERFTKRDKLFCFDDFDDRKLSNYKNDFALDFKANTAEQLDTDKKKIDELLTTIKQLIVKINKHNLSRQEGFKAKVDLVNTKIKDDAIAKQISLAVTRQSVLGLSKFQYVSDTYNMEGDETLVNIKIEPKAVIADDKCKGLKEADSRQIEIAVTGRTRITLSSGFFLSNLTNDKYILKEHTTYDAVKGYDTVNFKQVINETRDKISVGITLLAHFTYKFNKMHEAGLHIGIGTPLQSDFKINYLTGLSYFYGFKQRVGLHFGVAGGQVTKLSNAIDLKRKYAPSYTGTFATTEKFVFDRWQCSITFNIDDIFKKPEK